MSHLALSRMAAVVGCAALLVSLPGCSSDDVVVGSRRAASKIAWAIPLNHKSITMAVGEQLQLTATPVTSTGEPVTDLPVPTFISSDTSLVKVDATGKLTAVREADGVTVIARLVNGRDSVTLADTAQISVTATARGVSQFRLQSDSTTIPVSFNYLDVAAQVLDGAGNPIPEAVIQYWSANPRIADIFPWGLSVRDTGQVYIYAQATIYGVRYTDSLRFTILYPTEVFVDVYPRDYTVPSQPYFALDKATIRAGGKITWRNWSGWDVDIIFDDPSKVTGGNIANVPNNETASRVFPTVGTHRYRSVKYGITGTVTVIP